MTYPRRTLLLYSSRDPAMVVTSTEAAVVALFVVEASSDLKRVPYETCLFKGPANIPNRFYARHGLKKPRAGSKPTAGGN